MTNEIEFLTEEFERHRPHLRAVAYRMLGSVSEAVQAAFRADTAVSSRGFWIR